MKNFLSISKTTEGMNHFHELNSVLKLSGFYDTFDKYGDFTIFAPNDEAFQELPLRVFEKLCKPENVGALRALLGFHILRGKIPAKQLLGKKSTPNIVGVNLSFESDADGLHVNNAQILEADITAINRFVHIIDRVLLPNLET